MGRPPKFATPDNTDSEESGEVFTDGDFCDSDEDLLNRDDNDLLNLDDNDDTSLTVNETINMDVKNAEVETNGNLNDNGQVNGDEPKVNGLNNGHVSDSENYNSLMDLRRDSNSSEQNTSIVGILGGQQNYVRIVFFIGKLFIFNFV